MITIARAKQELGLKQGKLIGNQPRCCESCGQRGYSKVRQLLPYEVVADKHTRYYFWMHGQCAAELRNEETQINLMIELASLYYPIGYSEE